MFKVLGDVHAGRKFINDVPLHRRGEREAEVLRQLEEELNVLPEITTHIQVGDLFDSFDVDNETLLQVAVSYNRAALVHPWCTYIIIAGNHDRSKDETKVSSFKLFEILMGRMANIRVLYTPGFWGSFGFLPWRPNRSAKELAEELVSRHKLVQKEKLEAVFCHCDIASYGGDDFNLIPLAELSEITDNVITGHVHRPQKYVYEGRVNVTVVGSMQPYSHAEDVKGERYITVTTNQLRQIEPSTLRNKYVRVMLQEGEETPEIPDCMGFKTVQEAKKPEALEVEVEFKEFNTERLLSECMVELKIRDDIQKLVKGKFND